MTQVQLKKLLGPFPHKVPLKSKTISKDDCEDYIREKVEYSVERDERVRAYLLTPKKIRKRKCVIYCHHQHASNFQLGKSEVVGIDGDKNQAYAEELAKRGYITFAPDAIAFEERNLSNYTWHHNYYELAVRLIQGKTLLAKVLHDIIVGIDYIESRTEFKSDKIGFIGHSYGGKMAIWAPVFDRRIKVSISNCGCVNYKNSINKDTGVQMELCVPNIVNECDLEDIVRLVEPCSLLISATTNDKWSRGAKEIYNYAKDSFSKGILELKIYEGNHSFTEEMRMKAYEFFDKYL